MADNRYSSYARTPDGFGGKGLLVTPGATDLGINVKGVICTTAGDITIVPWDNLDGETITFTAVPAFFIPPYRVRRVTAATATVYTIEN
ncbi:spike base protein, RCAP_Rcc01079 family [Rhizobium leguminosarum]|uniref:spike base protein, RCAP_Rcc01079 family n=1 Tax=Rhizobium leguminosarum TaxID=384 RepID=UPI001441E9D9|nr:hypothetical protein [Rhizobium leguminosarum]MBY5863276.1 hypothetical protein [Rhizobium leguminosarum]NKM04156.1 hypothetical protein [Rhizobium leguminosarum bv. viciae]